jgi:uncharacterized protein (DUF983 family)
MEGRVFCGLTRMNERCPQCNHKFAREEGYFLGALYVSYVLSIPILGLIALLIYWLILPSWHFENVILVALVPFTLLVPTLFRYARVVWMHFDLPLTESESLRKP